MPRFRKNKQNSTPSWVYYAGLLVIVGFMVLYMDAESTFLITSHIYSTSHESHDLAEGLHHKQSADAVKHEHMTDAHLDDAPNPRADVIIPTILPSAVGQAVTDSSSTTQAPAPSSSSSSSVLPPSATLNEPELPPVLALSLSTTTAITTNTTTKTTTTATTSTSSSSPSSMSSFAKPFFAAPPPKFDESVWYKARSPKPTPIPDKPIEKVLSERAKKAPVTTPGYATFHGCDASPSECFRFVDGSDAEEYWRMDDLSAQYLQDHPDEQFAFQKTKSFFQNAFSFMLDFNPWRRRCSDRKHWPFLRDCPNPRTVSPEPMLLTGIDVLIEVLGEGPHDCNMGLCESSKSKERCRWKDVVTSFDIFHKCEKQLCYDVMGEPQIIPEKERQVNIRSFQYNYDDPHYYAMNWWPVGMFRWKPIPFDQKRDVMFLSSNCRGRDREQRGLFAEKLAKHGIKVDSFGSCYHTASMTMFPECNGLESSKASELAGNPLILCIHAHYKFVLVGENSAFFRYITEKLWMPLAVGAVPLYFGSVYSKDVSPSPEAVVHVPLEFDNDMGALASFIKEHVKNERKYNKLIEWRRKPFSEGFKASMSKSGVSHFCFLCDSLFQQFPQDEIHNTKGCSDGMNRPEDFGWPPETIYPPPVGWEGTHKSVDPVWWSIVHETQSWYKPHDLNKRKTYREEFANYNRDT